MSLYCVTCRSLAEDGSAVCRNCGNGFTSQLACATCHRVVQRGTAFCETCAVGTGISMYEVPAPDIERDRQAIMRRPSLPVPSGAGLTLPHLPGISLEHARVVDSYQAGDFGARADVQMNGRDANILTKMNQTIVLLHALAQEMNNFCALSDSTRRVIKGCRNLATDMQEEVETRVGRQR